MNDDNKLMIGIAGFVLSIVLIMSVLLYVPTINDVYEREITVITDVQIIPGSFLSRTKWNVLFGNSEYNSNTYFNIDRHFANGSVILVTWVQRDPGHSWWVYKVENI